MSLSDLITPDLEDVLREIAADPRAKLLSIEPRRLLSDLRAGFSPEAATPGMPGLSVAERHLLRTHRNELAWALRQAYYRSLRSVESEGARTILDREPSSAREISSAARSGAKTTVRLPSGIADSVADMLVALDADGDMPTQEARGLLELSLLIEPHPSAWICLANEGAENGCNVDSALQYTKALQALPDRASEQAALHGLGRSLLALGRYEVSESAARSALSIALEGDTSAQLIAVTALGSLLSACALGDVRAVAFSGRQLMQTLELSAPWVPHALQYARSNASPVRESVHKELLTLAQQSGSNPAALLFEALFRE